MAFALRLLYLDERHYIHRLYSTKANDTNPKTTTNMNFAMLFETESQAMHWRQKKNLPKEFEVIFIPLAIHESVKEEKKYYNVLKSGKSFNESIPDFFKER